MNEFGSDHFFSKSELIIPKNKKVVAFLSKAIFEKSGNFGFWYLNVENPQNPLKRELIPHLELYQTLSSFGTNSSYF